MQTYIHSIRETFEKITKDLLVCGYLPGDPVESAYIRARQALDDIDAAAKTNDTDIVINRCFDVVLPWNPGDLSEGDYAITMEAKDDQEAVSEVANLMADMLYEEDDEGERDEFVANLVKHGGLIQPTEAVLAHAIGSVFSTLLFPNGEREINILALGKVLLANRDAFVIEPNERYAESIIGDEPERYDALEIQPIRDLHEKNDPDGTCFEVDYERPELFSVYVHYSTECVHRGGVECVGDFGTYAMAKRYAEELSAQYTWRISDFVPVKFQ